jgi:hypothetical protein
MGSLQPRVRIARKSTRCCSTSLIMNIFLSYASSDEDLAKRLTYALRDGGDSVFFDRDTLPPGETYDARIRAAIEGCELFLFLVSPRACCAGSYALAELGMAEHSSVNRNLKVLPVMISDVDLTTLPPYLRSLTILRPQGDIVAETAAAVAYECRAQPPPALPTLLFMMPADEGWRLDFQFDCGQNFDSFPLRIDFRFDDEQEFRSTGFVTNRRWTPKLPSGEPYPNTSVTVRSLAGKREVILKWVDQRGRDRGPYRLPLDLEARLTDFAKEGLEQMKAWVALAGSDARPIIFFGFLLNPFISSALREIRYSIDDDSLSQRFNVKPLEGSPVRYETDEIHVEVPSPAHFAWVELTFADGSKWPPRRFDRTFAC